MDDRELMDELRRAAEEVKAPEALSPENIQKKLEEETRKPRRNQTRVLAGVVAAVFVLMAVGVTGTLQRQFSKNAVTSDTSSQTASKKADTSSDTASAKSEASSSANASVSSEQTKEAGTIAMAKALDQAEDYRDVYDAITQAASQQDIIYEDATVDSEAVSKSVASDTTTSGTSTERGFGIASSYTGTNVMEEGVDEGDVMKTDGTWFYIMNERDGIKIASVDDPDTIISKITPQQNPSDFIDEMYLDENRLIVLMTSYQADLTAPDEESKKEAYSINETVTLRVITYDVSDRTKPKKIGETTQDGYYSDSRKVGNYVYAISEYTLYNPLMRNGENVPYEEASEEDYLPKVNGEAMAAEDVMICPDRDSQTYMVITAVNVQKPEQVSDSKAVLAIGTNFYASQSSLYFDKSGGNNTMIVKFDFADGKVTPRGAATIPGYIESGFSMNEYDGHLRVVSTEWSEQNTNALFIFDDEMNMTGKISDIAPGESIQSARFLNDTGYFVTYRNTDPLFSVDLSDPADPKIIGSLKVTGFSDYLHFWGDDKLFGLGYETDPDTGARLGLKLSMYDISDPTHVSEIDRVVIENVDGCVALDHYKALMIDVDKNVIGFMTYYYTDHDAHQYLVYGFEDGHFVNHYIEAVDQEIFGESMDIRGVCVDDTFYLVGYQKIITKKMW